MKFSLTTLLIMLPAMLMQFACSNGKRSADTESLPGAEAIPELKYDSVRAAEYGAEEYGMKKYVMAFLKRGPDRSQDSATAARLQNAHLQNIRRMAEEGKLVLAGPFLGMVICVESIYLMSRPLKRQKN